MPLLDEGTDSGDVTDDICRSITQAIVDGRIEPGAKLPEGAIGGFFGVSRTVVRSAMNRLQRERLVELKKNRGVFVARPTVDEAKHLYDVRRVIERAVVERVIGRIAPKDIKALLRHTEREDQVHANGSRVDAVRLSGEFHLRLSKFAGNAVLQDLLEGLIRRSALAIATYGSAHGNACGSGDHRALIHAIEQGDRDGAWRIMDAHLQDVEASMLLDQAPSEEASLIQVLAHYAKPAAQRVEVASERRVGRRSRS